MANKSYPAGVNGTESTITVTTYDNIEYGWSIRVINRDDGVWFEAQSLCEALGIKNNRSAVATLDEDEVISVGIYDGNRGNPNKTFVSESGFNKLAFRGRSAEARAMTNWVARDVLPSIRRHGAYVVDTNDPESAMSYAFAAAKDAVARAEERSRILADGVLAISEERDQLASVAESEGVRADVAEMECRKAHESVEMLEVSVSEQKGRADALAAIVRGINGTMPFTDFARYLTQYDKSIRRKDVIDAFADAGFITKRGVKPTQKGIRRGVVAPAPISHHKGSDGTRRLNPQRARVTTKGMAWAVDRFVGIDARPEVLRSLALPPSV